MLASLIQRVSKVGQPSIIHYVTVTTEISPAVGQMPSLDQSKNIITLCQGKDFT